MIAVQPYQERFVQFVSLETKDSQLSNTPWIRRCQHTLEQNGVLQTCSFAVKGMISVVGQAPSLGNPAWDAEQVPAQTYASCVLPLLAAGAKLEGTTVLDELALGVTGVNPHTGVPTNPNAPERVPGGSSSGSAVVVASGEVSFALGSDTGGSIRVPASWCGVFGWRPTHGLIPTEGVPVHAPSLDVVGVLASCPSTLEAVGIAYSCQSLIDADTPELVLLRDLVELGDAVLWNAHEAKLRGFLKTPLSEISLAELFDPMPMTIDLLTCTFLHIGLYEVWSTRSAWAATHRGDLSDSVRGMLAAAEQISYGQYMEAMVAREHMQRILRERLNGRVLVFPTTPGPAPLRAASCGNPADADNSSVQALCALSSITGFPQLSIPLVTDQGTPPRGLSFLGGPNKDMELILVAKRLFSSVVVAT